jgi:hypothetical protein
MLLRCCTTIQTLFSIHTFPKKYYLGVRMGMEGGRVVPPARSERAFKEQ